MVEKGFNLLKDCIINHPEIEPTLWTSALISILVDCYSCSGFNYNQFTEEFDAIKKFYKFRFN